MLESFERARRPVAVLVGEFGFLAGSIGRATADRLVAAISRATPNTLRQSPRLGVNSMSSTVSSRLRCSVTACPTVAVSSNSRMPADDSSSPISAAEQRMPPDISPPILTRRTFSPFGRVLPGNATAALTPIRAFEAPQTIRTARARPRATSHIRSVSLEG